MRLIPSRRPSVFGVAVIVCTRLFIIIIGISRGGGNTYFAQGFKQIFALLESSKVAHTLRRAGSNFMDGKYGKTNGCYLYGV
jgi:hypothetical protein